MTNTSKDKASRSNPWLEIPLADYEGHMSLPSVGQAAMLAEQLRQLMAAYSPASVAVIGCAGGNGLECIAGALRVVAIDINPDYLRETIARHAARLPGLEVHCADVREPMTFEPVHLIYAALVFEYVNVPQVLAGLRRICRTGGRLVALLQLEHAGHGTVSASPYASMQRLAPVLRLHSPRDFEAAAAAQGFELDDSRGIALDSGKRFLQLTFRAG